VPFLHVEEDTQVDDTRGEGPCASVEERYEAEPQDGEQRPDVAEQPQDAAALDTWLVRPKLAAPLGGILVVGLHGGVALAEDLAHEAHALDAPDALEEHACDAQAESQEVHLLADVARSQGDQDDHQAVVLLGSPETAALQVRRKQVAGHLGSVPKRAVAGGSLAPALARDQEERRVAAGTAWEPHAEHRHAPAARRVERHRAARRVAAAPRAEAAHCASEEACRRQGVLQEQQGYRGLADGFAAHSAVGAVRWTNRQANCTLRSLAAALTRVPGSVPVQAPALAQALVQVLARELVQQAAAAALAEATTGIRVSAVCDSAGAGGLDCGFWIALAGDSGYGLLCVEVWSALGAPFEVEMELANASLVDQAVSVVQQALASRSSDPSTCCSTIACLNDLQIPLPRTDDTESRCASRR